MTSTHQMAIITFHSEWWSKSTTTNTFLNILRGVEGGRQWQATSPIFLLGVPVAIKVTIKRKTEVKIFGRNDNKAMY